MRLLEPLVDEHVQHEQNRMIDKPREAHRPLRSVSDGVFALLLLLPALVVMCFVIALPLGQGLWLSVHYWVLTDPGAGSPYVGLKQFGKLLTDPNFWQVLKNTAVFAGGSVGLQFVIGFALALLLNQNIRFRNFFHGLFLLPWVIPSAAASLLWLWMYSADFGAVNFLFQKLGLMHSFQNWSGCSQYAMRSVIAANAWKGAPFMMLMLLAGLQSIPSDIQEAAAIDGATVMQRFRHITLAYLKPIIMIVTLLGIIWEFQNFTLIWVLAKGNCGTETLAVHIFKTAFESPQDFGQAAAAGVVWLILLLGFSAVYVRILGGED